MKESLFKGKKKWLRFRQLQNYKQLLNEQTKNNGKNESISSIWFDVGLKSGNRLKFEGPRLPSQVISLIIQSNQLLIFTLKFIIFMKQELSRKQLRKAKKQQKKQRKQIHNQYISKVKSQQLLANSKAPPKLKNHPRNNILSKKHVEEQQISEYDQQLDQQVSDMQREEPDAFDGMEEQYEGQMDIHHENLGGQGDPEDQQIEKLQQRLGISSKQTRNNKYQKIAKGFGFDDDLFSFLDNISKKVKGPLKKRPSKNQLVNKKEQSGKISKKQPKMKKAKKEPEANQSIQFHQLQQAQFPSQQKGNPVEEEPIAHKSENITPDSQHAIKITKSMTSLFNKISDGNLTITFREFLNIFEGYPKVQTIPIFSNLFVKFNLLIQKPLLHILTANIVIGVAMTMVYGARIIANMIKQLTINYLKLDEQQEDHEEIEEIGYSKVFEKKKNFISIICYFYEFGVISADFIYSLIMSLSGSDTSEQNIEFLYIILQKCGQKLRNNDTSVLKEVLEIIKKIIEKSKLNNLYETTKIKFIEIQINEIRFNRKSLFSTDQRMGFLHTFLTKIVTAEAPVIQNKQYMLMLTYEQIKNADVMAPFWWEDTSQNRTHKEDDQRIAMKDTEEVKQLKQLAKTYRFVTENRKSIFVELMSSKDFIEATQKILQLRVRKLEDIAIVLVETNIQQPNTFNPFYVLVATKICEEIPKFRVSLQFAIWDRIKQFEDYAQQGQLRKISNLGKFLGWLLASPIANCSLTILKCFTDMGNLSAYENSFMKVVFKELFRKCDQKILIKLVSKLKDSKNKGMQANIRQYLQDFEGELGDQEMSEKGKKSRVIKQSMMRSVKLMKKLMVMQEEQQFERQT